MERYTLKIADTVYSDIREIKDGIIEKYDAIENAEIVEGYILEAIASLDVFPNGHRLYRYNDELKMRLRVATANRKYNVYYTVDDADLSVVVVAVIHVRRDVRRILIGRWGR